MVGCLEFVCTASIGVEETMQMRFRVTPLDSSARNRPVAIQLKRLSCRKIKE